MAKVLKETLITIEKYKNASPHYGELLEILGEILILREEHRRKIKKAIFTVDENLVQKKLEGGLPLVDFTGGNIDLEESETYFHALLKRAEQRNPGETKEIREKIKRGKIVFADMVRDSFTVKPHRKTAEQEEESVFDLLSFLIEESLRPSLEILAEHYGQVIDDSDWSEGYCPVCGKEPKIAEITGEEGKRLLFCGQCGIEWYFERIKCPFCCNDRQQTLSYFTIEGEEKYRVDVCNECGRYIKIVDFRETSEKPNLDVEDIATLHLDILANDEGYE
jgi:FdhE protein